MLPHDRALAVHEEALEILEFLCHLHTLLLSSHEGSKAFRYLDVGINYSVNFLLKLCRMGCLAEYPDFSFFQSFLQSTISTSTMTSLWSVVCRTSWSKAMECSTLS